MGGSFTVGTEDEPFLQEAQITLHGSPVSKELPLYGAKVLACRRCTMDLHGKPTIPIWTSLNHTAAAGAKEICFTQPVDWALGSQLVITSSGFDMNEAEQRTMVSLTQGGRCVSFDTPLRHQHLGETSALSELAPDPFLRSSMVPVLSSPSYPELLTLSVRRGNAVLWWNRDRAARGGWLALPQRRGAGERHVAVGPTRRPHYALLA
jgi:hypothetical protein